jgi:hypothetical protein
MSVSCSAAESTVAVTVSALKSATIVAVLVMLFPPCVVGGPRLVGVPADWENFV